MLYVPRNENGHMDESTETTRIDLWKEIAPHKGIDLDSIFYPENVGYVVGQISRGNYKVLMEWAYMGMKASTIIHA